MNTEAEIRQAFADYQHATSSAAGPGRAPTRSHPADAERFARHADGLVETLPGLD